VHEVHFGPGKNIEKTLPPPSRSRTEALPP
jgi:hypothetical protein